MNIIDLVTETVKHTSEFELVALVDCELEGYAPVFKPVFFTHNGVEYGLFFTYDRKLPKNPLEGLVPRKVFGVAKPIVSFPGNKTLLCLLNDECPKSGFIKGDPLGRFNSCSLYLWNSVDKGVKQIRFRDILGSAWYETIVENVRRLTVDAYNKKKNIVKKYVWENFIVKELKTAYTVKGE